MAPCRRVGGAHGAVPIARPLAFGLGQAKMPEPHPIPSHPITISLITSHPTTAHRSGEDPEAAPGLGGQRVRHDRGRRRSEREVAAVLAQSEHGMR
jgi:hypothetical protein